MLHVNCSHYVLQQNSWYSDMDFVSLTNMALHFQSLHHCYLLPASVSSVFFLCFRFHIKWDFYSVCFSIPVCLILSCIISYTFVHVATNHQAMFFYKVAFFYKYISHLSLCIHILGKEADPKSWLLWRVVHEHGLTGVSLTCSFHYSPKSPHSVSYNTTL